MNLGFKRFMSSILAFAVLVCTIVMVNAVIVSAAPGDGGQGGSAPGWDQGSNPGGQGGNQGGNQGGQGNNPGGVQVVPLIM